MANDVSAVALDGSDIDRLDQAIDRLTFLALSIPCVMDSGGTVGEDFTNGALLVAMDAIGTLRDIRDRATAARASTI